VSATPSSTPTLDQLALCFEGAVPAVIATAAADGTPNITYISRVQRVDDERIALSNQFFSKTSRNLAENPRASVVILDPTTYDQYRLAIAYERTERRGPVFERLRADVDALAALEGMQDVFKLRAADIYRVLHIERMPSALCRPEPSAADVPPPRADGHRATALAEMATRLARCPDLDTLVTTTVDGLAELFGYENSMLLLLDEAGRRLYTIASRGYAAEGVGSEVVVGEGMIGMAAARCTPLRIGNLRQMSKYSWTVRRSYEGSGELPPERVIAVPDLPDVQSRIAVPALALGQLVGVVVVESARPVAFTADDEAALAVVATLIAGAVETERTQDRTDGPVATPPVTSLPTLAGPGTRVRFFEADGSTFLDGDYLIKGVAGRILWALLGHRQREGRVEFTNRELRLDPSLDLPAFRDNFESRLILLKRRLDERHAPIRIEKTARGCFRLIVEGPLILELG
jgi:adenylate cyclase